MASLVVFPRRSDAFSAYRPSRNAHTDILAASSTAHTGKVITLNVQREPLTPPADQRTASKLPLEDATQLAAVQGQVPLVLAGKTTEISFNRISDYCRNLVLYSEAPFEAMYRTIDSELEKSTKRIARTCQAAILGRDAKWLEVLISTWETYKERAVSIPVA